VAVNAGEQVNDLLQDAREIAVSAQDEGLDAASRDALNNDFQSIVSQIDSVVGNAQFNGNNLVGGSPDDVSAITGVTRDSSVTSVSVEGVDLRASGVNAESTGVQVGDTVTLNSDFFSNVTEDGTTQGLTDLKNNFDQELRDAIENQGLDANDILDGTSNNALNFANSEATVDVNFDGNTDRVAFNIGDAEITIEGDFGDTDRGTVLGNLDSNTISSFDSITVSGSQDVENAENSQTIDRKVSELDLSSNGPVVDRDAAVKVVDNFADQVEDALARFGADSQQISSQADFTSNLQDTVEEGIGNLVDADLARESAQLQSLQTQQQLGLQALGIANQAPQAVLSLFGG